MKADAHTDLHDRRGRTPKCASSDPGPPQRGPSSPLEPVFRRPASDSGVFDGFGKLVFYSLSSFVLPCGGSELPQLGRSLAHAAVLWGHTLVWPQIQHDPGPKRHTDCGPSPLSRQIPLDL